VGSRIRLSALLSLLPRPHLLLFALQFLLDAAEVTAELLLEFVHGIGVASEKKFASALAREATQIGASSLSL
jgi:hypothetical protein